MYEQTADGTQNPKFGHSLGTAEMEYLSRIFVSD